MPFFHYFLATCLANVLSHLLMTHSDHWNVRLDLRTRICHHVPLPCLWLLFGHFFFGTCCTLLVFAFLPLSSSLLPRLTRLPSHSTFFYRTLVPTQALELRALRLVVISPAAKEATASPSSTLWASLSRIYSIVVAASSV